MTSRTLAVASLLAASLPLVSHAQVTSTASGFYLGAGANLLSNLPFNPVGFPQLVGPSLTAGFQLTPHVALQAGVSYQWQKRQFSQADSLFAADGGPVAVGIYQSEHRFKYFIMPVLLRYTFAPSAERFHVDALGGVTLVAATRLSRYEGPATTQPDVYQASTFQASLTLGPAVRYTLSPQLALTASSLASATLGKSYYRFSNRLFLNTSIGINYTFG